MRPTKPSNSKGKQRSTEPVTESPTESQPEPPAVVPVKKKKKAKKVVHHEAPDPAKLGLGKGPPAERTETHGYDGGVSPINEEAGQWVGSQGQRRDEDTSGYRAADNDEFKNVWGRDEEAGY